MDFIRVTKENIDKEHICCAISSEKDIKVSTKKNWLRARLEEGLVFLKADARGKCFIEYIPAEFAWAPIDAEGWMYINCLWVSGKDFKGKGYSSHLIDECIKDSKEQGKKGIVILSSGKKRSFLADKKYLLHKGFSVADSAPPYFELMYLPFHDDEKIPSFKAQVKDVFHEGIPKGFVIYYTDQCPFTAYWVKRLIESEAEKGIDIKAIHIETLEGAQGSLSPFTTYSLFKDGEFITHEILSEHSFEDIVKKLS